MTSLRLSPLALFATVSALAGCSSNCPAPVAPAQKAPPIAGAPTPAAVDAGGATADAAPDATPLSLSPPAPAPPADGPFAKVEIKVVPVAGNVYMLQGQGGNIGVLAGEDGIVIVDDEFAPLAAKIRAALRGISDRPIKFVINTHWHGDHTGGNVAFSSDGPIVAQENVRRRLMEGRPKFELAGKTVEATPPAPREALPVVTFEDNVSIHVNGEDVRAVHFPNGHTDGDAIIFFPKANVVHMGDDFFANGFPFVDAASGGTVRGLIAALDKVMTTLPADVKVIPGHGDLSTRDDLAKFAAMLKDVVSIVEKGLKQKQTLSEMKTAKVLSKYEALGRGFVSADAFLEVIYKELTESKGATKPKAPAAAR